MSYIDTRIVLSDPWVYFERMTCDGPGYSEPHRHGAWHFTAALNKTLVFRIQDKEYEVPPGSWILFSAEMIHSSGTRESDTVILQMFFTELPQDLLPEVASLLNFRTDFVLQGTFSPFVLKYVEERFQTQLQPGKLFQKSWGKLLPQLFLLDALSGLDEKDLGFSNPVPDFLQNTLNYMEQHYVKAIGLQELAAIAHLSPSRFNTVFRELTGASPLQYLRRIRLRQAQNMMLAGVSIRETARRCGFSTVQYFYRFFKQIAHQTPAQFLANPYHVYVSKSDTKKKKKSKTDPARTKKERISGKSIRTKPSSGKE